MSGEGQGMTDKAPDAFRTISEVADDLDLPQHVLRFWETRFPQIKPLKRGGGRRYYRPDDVLLLRGIRHLLYGEGYTIKGVQRILKESGARAVQAAWQEEPADDEAAGASAAPAAPVQDRFEPDDFQDDQFQPDEPEPDQAAEAFDEAVLDEREMARDAAPSASLAAGEDEADAPDAPAPGPVPETAAPAPEPASAPLPAAPGRYVANANVSIVRGGLPKQHREGAPAALDRRAEPAGPRFSAEDVQTLKGVLFELIETRKALDLAVNRH